MRREHSSASELRPFLSGDVDLTIEQQTPFYIEPINKNGTITIKTSSATPSYQYSYNNSSWVTGTALSTSTTVSIACNGYSKIYFRASTTRGTSWNSVKFDVSGGFDIGGNLLSLSAGTNFKTATTLPSTYCFQQMFNANTNIRHAEKLVLGNTLLSDNLNVTGKTVTYGYVFNGTLPSYAYYQMFYQSSLVSSPRVIGTKQLSGIYCCQQMISNCKSLVHGPVSVYCVKAQARSFAYFSSGCSELKYTPLQIYFTTYNSSAGTDAKAFEGAFSGCSNMVVGLPKRDLPSSSYKLNGRCLITQGEESTIPVLPTQFFYVTFNNCSKLEYMTMTIRSTTTGTNTFTEMFKNNTVLNYVYYNCSLKVGSYHSSWLSGVASSGQLIAPKGSSWGTLSQSVSTYPSGWTFATSE